jgi:hypothetical protein
VYAVFKSLEKYAKSRIEEHRATFDPDNIRDFVDIFLQNEGGSGDDAINGRYLTSFLQIFNHIYLYTFVFLSVVNYNAVRL